MVRDTIRYPYRLKYRPATYRAVSPFSALSRHHSRLGGS